MSEQDLSRGSFYDKQHKTWMWKWWEDEEPDRFHMSVESSGTFPVKHLVVSGCATWLTLEQAKEVQVFLAECIELMEQDPAAPEQELADDYARNEHR